ncbi:TetR family transcriptional regulator [Saccharothrix saharensis]|uniref:TetR family transcriptional regulator n=2 Tax=Saccharothrix saharensis TaxID=571190 RepID=A0A543J929_9PSEU|nr:TetR family transcriptional regulator [Saccharothrix saharensis]
MCSAELDLTARARIRDAALARFGLDGVAGSSMRTIAADAGVSPALVVHHFGSKEGLRQACDEYVLSAMDRGDDLDGEALAEVLAAATPVRRYLGRALLDGTDTANALFARIVERTERWLAEGEAAGRVRPTTDARARAVVYVSWQLAPLVLNEQVGRVLAGDPAEMAVATRGARAGLEMLTGGLFTDDHWLRTFAELDRGERK